MKKLNVLTLLFLVFSALSYAQHAGNGLGLQAISSNYITVADDADFDIGAGFSMEIWVRPTNNVTDDQKLIGKSATVFPLESSYTLGIIDGQGGIEVFDEDSESVLVKAGSVSLDAWNHLACTFNATSQTLKLYINGQLVGENTNPNSGPFSFVTQPLIIGAAPWAPLSKNFTGNIDEVRFWDGVLEEATINEWMHQDVTDSHPNWDDLEMYHKYNEGMGQTAGDSSPGGVHSGDLSNVAQWVVSTAPFKGGYDLLSSTPVGVWEGHTAATSDILSVFGGSILAERSILLANDEAGYVQFFQDGPMGYELTLGQVWKATTQGVLPTVGISADITPLVISNVADVALVGAPSIAGFPTGTVFEGSFNGVTFEASNVTFEEGWFYTLAFHIDATSTQDLEENSSVVIFPNPSSGQFQISFEQEQSEDVQIQIFNINGQLLTHRMIDNTSQFTETFDLGQIPAGVYNVQIKSGERVTNKRITIQ